MGSEWRRARVGAVADVVGGGTPSTKVPDYFDGEIPWMSPKDLSGKHDRYVARGARNISQLGLSNSSAKLLPAGAVLLSTRAPVGYVAIAANALTTNQGFRSLVCSDDLLPEYLYYWLTANTAELERHASGTTFRELSGSSLKNIELPVPPVPEQQAIASILGALDDKIELNRKMSRTLDEMARTIFESRFVSMDGRDVDSLTGVPAGWERVTLGSLCEKPQYGYTESGRTEAIGPRFLRIADINKQPWIEWESVPYCPISESDLAKYRLHRGDLVIARIADPGHAAYIETSEDAVFASYLIRFRPRDPAHGRYLQYWLKSDAYWNLVRGRASGSTRANLNARVLSSFPLVLPASDALGDFSGVVSRLRERISLAVVQASALAALRDTLLPRLLSGELRIPDAEKTVEEVL